MPRTRHRSSDGDQTGLKSLGHGTKKVDYLTSPIVGLVLGSAYAAAGLLLGSASGVLHEAEVPLTLVIGCWGTPVFGLPAGMLVWPLCGFLAGVRTTFSRIGAGSTLFLAYGSAVLAWRTLPTGDVAHLFIDRLGRPNPFGLPAVILFLLVQVVLWRGILRCTPRGTPG